MSAESLVDDHSPKATIGTNSTGGGGNTNSPRSSRGSHPSQGESAVREDSESISNPTTTSAAEKDSVENLSPENQSEGSGTVNKGSEGNVGSPRRPAWRKPINGVVDPGSVMGGAVSWPALSESIRLGQRSSDSSSPFLDASPSSSQKQANSHANANVAANQTLPTRPRPMVHRGRGGGVISPRSGLPQTGFSSPSQTGFNSPSPPLPPPVPPPYIGMHYGPVVPPVMNTPARGMRLGGIRSSQSHGSNDHTAHRNNSRRGSFGQRGRGDAPHNNNHGGRRDQDRRDGRLHHQYIRPPIVYIPPPPPPVNGMFIRHPHMRGFADPVAFDMTGQMLYYPTLPSEPSRSMPLMPPPPPLTPMPLPTVMDSLRTSIVRQIDYYFSDVNLQKDVFLKQNMDKDGWVSVFLIVTFPRVKLLTEDTQFILDSLRASTVVEVQGEKMRRRGWDEWVKKEQDMGDSGSQSSAEKFLATSLEKVSLDDASINVHTNLKALTCQSGEDTENITSVNI